MSDIRKWFMKQHAKNKANEPNSSNVATPANPLPAVKKEPEKAVLGEESSGRRKTSKYFSKETHKVKDEQEKGDNSTKRKAVDGNEKPSPVKRLQIVDDGDDDDFVLPISKKGTTEGTPSKKLKTSSGRAISQKAVVVSDSDEEKKYETKTPIKSAGRGHGGRGTLKGKADMDIDEGDDEDEINAKSSEKASGRGRGRGGSTASSGGRGRGGGGRGGFMNFGERKDPPHKGEKEVPEGAPDCLAGLTFVISGTLDSLEREEAEDLIKRHGGRITGSVSKKTNYLLCDEDIGGRKSEKAKELGTSFLTEDGLFDMIRSSKKGKLTGNGDSKKPVNKAVASSPKKTPQKEPKNQVVSHPAKRVATKEATRSPIPAKKKDPIKTDTSMPWTVKYKPKTPNDIIGNQSLVKQLHDWLKDWDNLFLHVGNKEKGKKQNDSGPKKAVLLSGTPGIGKTTSAKLVSLMLGFQPIEVNASDNRGKADAKIEKGIGGSTANSIKELVSNEALITSMDRSKRPKPVLIMDEVDGMSAGDRGGVADLIASIKISKVPIICICNDRYSQKLKSLMNYCLPLNFRKPTKQQMAKRLMQVANAEGLQVNEVALEELAERVNGDMRMALNQLQYMSLSKSVIKYDDVRKRLLSSAKDEDISPFTAVDKLFGFNAGKLRMDERIDLSMSDPDLVPLLIQENYINYRPSSAGKDDGGLKRMKLISRAADSIADGDIVNVQIRRYRQWQLSQTGTLASCIIPSALLHGQREPLEQGERNYNRFGGWLGKNSTTGKNVRLLEDLHVHLLASRGSSLGRATLRLDYLNIFLKQLTDPLKVLSKEEAVEKVMEFMDSYSISQEDFDTVVEMSKFKGYPNPLDGVHSTVKSALTRAYNKGTSSRVIRTADLITLPGIKKAPKKRVAAMLEPVDGLAEDNNTLAENGEISSDTEDLEGNDDSEEKLQLDLQSLNSKGIQVQMDLNGSGSTGTKKATSAVRGGKASRGGRGSGATTSKRKK